jgi:hypothetical protein
MKLIALYLAITLGLFWFLHRDEDLSSTVARGYALVSEEVHDDWQKCAAMLH